MIPYRLLSALSAATAGAALFLIFLNRVLGRIPDNIYKMPAMALSFVALIGGGLALGFFFCTPLYLALYGAVLLAVLLGELRERAIKRSCSGSVPQDSIPHTVDVITPVTTTDLEVHRYRLELGCRRGPPLKIVHISDMHVNPAIRLQYYRKVMQTAKAEQADLAFFTGDFVNRAEYLPQLSRVLTPIARLGDFAVLGNHDYWSGADAVRRTLADSGLQVLDNRTVMLQHGDNTIAITGYDYPWGTRERRLERLPDADLHIVLSHAPDNIYRIAAAGADLAFCGHHHGGQFRIPGLGAVVVPSAYGRRFDHGHFVIEKTHLFVPAGVGAANPPLRLYCRPDIFTVEICAKRAGT